ncbi:MAG TPA: hypothetical protein VLL52_04690 [Anaerolineae bacterium]|nr:hypothetical protein [Anaerolineae bacterium]
MKKHATFLLLLTLWLIPALACNAITTLDTTPSAPPTSPPLTSTLPTTGQLPAPTITPLVGPGTPLPTFTPRQPTPLPTPPPDSTPTIEITPTITATVTPTPTPFITGPLTLSYVITWTVDANNTSEAIGFITLTASGGLTNTYQYYHDDLLQPGPKFSFRWRTCTDRPGSVRVDAGGESVRINYYERAICPPP